MSEMPTAHGMVIPDGFPISRLRRSVFEILFRDDHELSAVHRLARFEFGAESVVFAFELPDHAIERLFGMGSTSEDIGLLTHPVDDRNRPLLAYAQAHAIEIVEWGRDLKQCVTWVESRRPDLLFSLHFRSRIPEEILSIPAQGAVNLHPSLLPEYRGCFSVPWAIINGEDTTGFSYHYMEEEFDAGDIVLQETVEIRDNDTAFSLFHRLIARGMQAFESVVDTAMSGRSGTPQQGEGSYYGRRLPYDGQIDPEWAEDEVERFIRAMDFPPHSGASLCLKGRTYQVDTIEAYRRILRGEP